MKFRMYLALALSAFHALSLTLAAEEFVFNAHSTTIGQQSAEETDFMDKVKNGDYRKIGDQLGKLYDLYGVTGIPPGLNEEELDYLYITQEGDVVVEVVFRQGISGELNEPFLAQRGFQKQNDCIKNVCPGFVRIDRLVSLSEIDDIVMIMPVLIPVTSTGIVTSEGDQAMESDIARPNFGVTGNGVTVGVLSDTFNCLGGYATDISTSDLPSGIVPLEDSTDSCSDEGRAMLQLIHDVAPGAKLEFHTASPTPENFAQGIKDLAAAGCNVIVDDINYPLTPWFQDGVVAQAASEVVRMGIPFFTSAGNTARRSWHTNSGFVDSGFTISGKPLHDFNPSSSAVDTVQDIYLEAGVDYQLILQWDEPWISTPGSSACTSDLDLYLVDSSDLIIGSSVDNNVGGNAYERIFHTATYTGRYGIAITLFSGNRPGYLKWLVIRGKAFQSVEYPVLSSTTFGHKNIEAAFAVGAARFSNTPRFGVDPAVQESFSSAGGTPIFFDTSGNRLSSPVTPKQPRVVGPDGTLTTFFGTGNRFSGTSAAAPHVAAVAALMPERNPRLTPSQIYSILQDTAEDMDDTATSGFDTGYDTGTGYGFVNANIALAATPMASSPTTPSPPTSPTTPSPTPLPTPECSCFSGSSTMIVHDRGEIEMKNVCVGDKVLTKYGYEPVYGFAHRDETSVSGFLVIYSTVSKSNPLMITSEHLLMVNDTFVPAERIRKGDVLQSSLILESPVTHIESVTMPAGLYAPLTPSGTLLVNGVHVSSYVSLQKNAPASFVLGNGVPTLSQHKLAHMLMSPIRIICIGEIFPRLCSNEYIDVETGYPPYVAFGFQLVAYFDRQVLYLQCVLFILFMVLIGPLFAIESVLGAANVPRALMWLLGIVALWKWSQRRCLEDQKMPQK